MFISLLKHIPFPKKTKNYSTILKKTEIIRNQKGLQTTLNNHRRLFSIKKVKQQDSLNIYVDSFCLIQENNNNIIIVKTK